MDVAQTDHVLHLEGVSCKHDPFAKPDEARGGLGLAENAVPVGRVVGQAVHTLPGRVQLDRVALAARPRKRLPMLGRYLDRLFVGPLFPPGLGAVAWPPAAREEPSSHSAKRCVVGDGLRDEVVLHVLGVVRGRGNGHVVETRV